MINIKYLVWALLAGSFIPLVGILNGRAGRVLGDSLQASVVLFVVTLLLAVAVGGIVGAGASWSRRCGTVTTRRIWRWLNCCLLCVERYGTGQQDRRGQFHCDGGISADYLFINN